MGEFFSARNYHQEAKNRRKKEKEREKGKELEKKRMEKKGEGGFVFNFCEHIFEHEQVFFFFFFFLIVFVFLYLRCCSLLLKIIYQCVLSLLSCFKKNYMPPVITVQPWPRNIFSNYLKSL